MMAIVSNTDDGMHECIFINFLRYLDQEISLNSTVDNFGHSHCWTDEPKLHPKTIVNIHLASSFD